MRFAVPLCAILSTGCGLLLQQSPPDDSAASMDAANDDAASSDAGIDSGVPETDGATPEDGSVDAEPPVDVSVDLDAADAMRTRDAPATCARNADCLSHEYCDFGGELCVGPGVCVVRPELPCGAEVRVCTCDGGSVRNACIAHTLGLSVAGGECDGSFCALGGTTLPVEGRCFADSHCTMEPRDTCVGAVCVAGGEGICVDPDMLAPDEECWDADDCGMGFRCIGASFDPDEPMPGRCVHVT